MTDSEQCHNRRWEEQELPSQPPWNTVFVVIYSYKAILVLQGLPGLPLLAFTQTFMSTQNLHIDVYSNFTYNCQGVTKMPFS